MDKKIILSVAGSGKTTYLLNDLNEEKRSLIITYTITNTQNIQKGILKKFGYSPKNIKLISFFTFLYSFCFRPYFLKDSESKGISFMPPPDFTKFKKRTDKDFYISENDKIYHNRISEYIMNNGGVEFIRNRLERYYDKLYIDEVQDIGGYDFTLLEKLVKANIDHLYVGDFFQHTFDTSRDGIKNKNLYEDHTKYITICKKIGLTVDTTTLINSHRCNSTVCDFIRKEVGIQIFSSSKRIGEIYLIEDSENAEKLFHNNSIVKLFYQNAHRYPCYSNNWGNCKGIDDYHDVCIVLNPETLKFFNSKTLSKLKNRTKNKFYVACTRTKGHIYFVSDIHYKKFII